MAYWVMGLNHGILGEFDAGLAAEAHTQAIAEHIGDDRLLSIGRWARGWILALRGDGAEAVASCTRALACSPEGGNRVQALGALGCAHVANGDARAAIAALRDAEQGQRRQGNHRLRGHFMAWLAEAYRIDGDMSRAWQCATEAIEITTAVEFPFTVARAQRCRGRVRFAAGDLDGAEEHTTEALKIFLSIDAAFEVERTRVDLAEVARARTGRASA